MEYMVWSYGLLCEFCGREFVLWGAARDERHDVRESKILTEFPCPHCGKYLQKRKLRRTKLSPVQIGYRCCGLGAQESKAAPDEYDIRTVESTDAAGIPRDLWYPTVKFPDGVNTRQAIAHGLTSVDALYTTRNLHAVARLWDIARREKEAAAGLKLMFTVTSLYQRVTRLSEFRFWGGSGNIANYNVPMIFNEQNVFKVFRRKAKTIRDYLETWQTQLNIPFCISTQSATDLSLLPDNSIDYIFTDPPFGSNINYSEMNYLWEAWLDTFTDTQNEAIVNRAQGKDIAKYRELITSALREMRRVLKPNCWLTLVFHNSSSEVWGALQQAVAASGFAISKVQTLDKRHGTFKQFVSENAVGYDLSLQCAKNSNVRIAVLAEQEQSASIAVRGFLERILAEKSAEFIVKYLHVKRQDELDARKLYSLWLKERMEAGQLVDVGFEQFRQIVEQTIQIDSEGHWVLKAE